MNEQASIGGSEHEGRSGDGVESELRLASALTRRERIGMAVLRIACYFAASTMLPSIYFRIGGGYVPRGIHSWPAGAREVELSVLVLASVALLLTGAAVFTARRIELWIGLGVLVGAFILLGFALLATTIVYYA